ncbi:phage head-tail connector protein [Streptomyces sioyaensis]|uniref:phage head-tail connector protein n=1 Tax=Streptomyces sioyaensis TaxID=67364 RepID=UPI003D7154A5
MGLGSNYADLPELKARVNINDTNDDAPLQDALYAASRFVERYTRRQFNDADTASARVYDPESAGLVMPDDFSTTVGLVIKTDDDDDGTFETTWSATDYELRPLNGCRDGVPGWPYWQILAVDSREFPNVRRAGVQITARWGWAAVPQPVKEATLILAEEIWKMKDAPFGVAGFGEFGSIRVRENPKVAALLMAYKRKAVLVR